MLIIGLVGATYAFFNYNLKGAANTVKTGDIFFDSQQGNTITLSHVQPMTKDQAMEADMDDETLSIHVTGNTTYGDGVEYLITLDGVNHGDEVGNDLPVSLLVWVEDSNGNELGSSNSNYYGERSNKNASIYRIHDNSSISDGQRVMVGYIKPDETGIDETINIRAFFDVDEILITDTIDELDEEESNKHIISTSELNSLSNEHISFQVKVEANDGIWVDEYAGEKMNRFISAESCFNTSDGVKYIAGNGNTCTSHNYVRYSGYTWRITAIYPDGAMKMVVNNDLTRKSYTTSKFENSPAYNWLNNDFYNTLIEPEKIIDTTKKWNATAVTDTSKPPETTMVSCNVGMLNNWEIMTISATVDYRTFIKESYAYHNNDSDCVLSLSPNTSPYVNIICNNFWVSRYAGASYNIRPAIYIKPTVVFTGDGTSGNPYKILGIEE